MTLTRALLTIGITTIVCTVTGIAVGAALGHWCPDYYSAVLQSRPGVELDAVQIGIGFGLNAGVFSGLVVGGFVVGIVAFFELRVRLAMIRQGEYQTWDPNKN